MTSARQDAWTSEEDRLLAEIVLTHIKKGSTQLKAFEETGSKLSRTAAACGFRWNSYVRKQFTEEIADAKQQRKAHLKSSSKQTLYTNSKQSGLTADLSEENSIQHILVLLNNLHSYQEALQNYQTDCQALKLEIVRVTEEAKEAKENYKKVQEDYMELRKEYESLLGYMEMARKLAMQETDH